MNQPWIYMCSPSWTSLSPPSPYHPSGTFQCTSPKHLSHASNLDWRSVSEWIICMSWIFVLFSAKYMGLKIRCNLELMNPVNKNCVTSKFCLYRIYHRDFPGGPVVKNLPSNAGDVGLILDQGTKISWGNWTHMLLLKKPCACAAAASPHALEHVHHN